VYYITFGGACIPVSPPFEANLYTHLCVLSAFRIHGKLSTVKLLTIKEGKYQTNLPIQELKTALSIHIIQIGGGLWVSWMIIYYLAGNYKKEL
jgi:hypothetical protein